MHLVQSASAEWEPFREKISCCSPESPPLPVQRVNINVVTACLQATLPVKVFPSLAEHKIAGRYHFRPVKVTVLDTLAAYREQRGVVDQLAEYAPDGPVC
jgi:hypothetical protein